jgi:signal transduction histidine kinase/DNA-binding response OmpR family regulator
LGKMQKPSISLLLIEEGKDEKSTIRGLLDKQALVNFKVTRVQRNQFEFQNFDTQFDAILLDINPLTGDVLAEIKRVSSRDVEAPITVLTDSRDPGLVKQVIQVGAQDCLYKNGITSESLVHAVISSIERKQKETTSTTRLDELENILKVARAGSWQWNYQTGQLSLNDETLELFGLDPQKITGNFEDHCLKAIRPSDQQRVKLAYNTFLAGKELKPVEFLITLPDGSDRLVVSIVGKLKRDGEGNPLLISGILLDSSVNKRQKDELFKRDKEITLLYKTSQKISESLNLDKVYLTFYKSVRQIIHFDNMFIASYDKVSQLIKAEFAIMEGKRVEVDAFPPLPLEPEGQGIQSPVIRSGKARLINDYDKALKKTNSNYYIDEEGKVVEEEDIPEDYPVTQSAMIIPMKLNNQVIGVVQVQSSELNAFGNDDFRIMKSLVSQIAVASNNAFLYQKSLSEIEKRKKTEEEIVKLNENLEKRVVKRTLQLESSNKELEAFAFTVSHDLRAPLRAIDGYSSILEEEYANGLDADGLRMLRVIRQSVGKMDQLITDLLSLSLVGKSEIKFVPLNMVLLVNEIIKEIVPSSIHDQFEFVILDLPDAEGDRSLIRQAWINLISNAVKYTMPKEKKVIEIRGERQEGLSIYSVKDNGVGFDNTFSDKLFRVFQRLPNATDFEGTGIGLAIVKRIIDRHGGQVWAEGRVGEGATFSFSIPEQVEG